MADQTIDSLNIQIESDANKAVNSLNQLVKTLSSIKGTIRSTTSSFGALGTSVNSLKNIDSVVGKIGRVSQVLKTFSAIDSKKLSKTVKIDVQIGDENLQKNIEKKFNDAIRNAKIDNSAYANQLFKDFNIIDSDAQAKIKSQLDNLTKSFSESFDGSNFDYSKPIAMIDDLYQSIASATNQIDSFQREYEDVYNFIKSSKIKLDDYAFGNLDSNQMQSYFQELPGILTKSIGEPIDVFFQDLSSRFPYMTGEAFGEAPATAQEQLDTIINIVRQARLELGDAITPFNQMAETQQKAVSEEISNRITKMFEDIPNKIQDSLSNQKIDMSNNILLDVGIDEEKLTSKIQSALNKIKNTKFTIPNLQIDIDKNQVSKDFKAQLKNLFSEEYSVGDNSKTINDFAESIQKLNNINFKDTEIANVTKEISKLLSVDTSNFNSSVIIDLSSALSNLGSAGINFTETGIDSVINSIRRLASVGEKSTTAIETIIGISNAIQDFLTQTSTYDPSDKIISMMESLATIANNSKGFNSAMNTIKKSMQEVGNQAEKTKKSVDDLEGGTDEGVVGLESINSTQSKLNELTESFRKFAEEKQKAFSDEDNSALGLSKVLGESSPMLSELLGNIGNLQKGFSSLLTIAKPVFTALKKGFDFVVKSAKEMASMLQKTVSGFATFSGKVKNFISNLNPFKGAMSSIISDLGRMATLMVGFYGIRSIGNAIKDAVEYGSSITEVENIVDNAFGNMSKSAYDFADIATEKFGLSRLSAMEYSGTLMSIFKSSGIAQQGASEMSVTLAGLAGDLASFYNIDAETAFTKLRSGVMGSVAPLRQLGINVSKANLQEFALAQGITKSYTAMTQAEKVMLRYNYIMEATTTQQGDFARTSGTWANQLRLLSMNFQSLGGSIGQGLISAILPALTWLNTLLAYLNKVAIAFRNFMYIITGGKLKGSAKGISDLADDAESVSDGLNDVGSAGGSASDGLGKASKKAKELKKQLELLPFDEINKLSDNLNNSTSGSGGSGGSGSGSGGVGGLSIGDDWGTASFDEDKIVDAWSKKLQKAIEKKDWYTVGRLLALKLNSAIDKYKDTITWEKLGGKITNFTDAVTKTLNSFMSNVRWKNIGQLIGNGMDIAIKTANKLIGGTKWENFGKAVSGIIVGVIDSNLDFYEIGELIANILNKTPSVIKGFVDDFTKRSGWSKVGKSLATALKGCVDNIKIEELGSTFGKLVKGIAKSIGSFVDQAKKDGTFEEIGNKLGTALSNVFEEKPLSNIGDSLGKLASGIINTLSGAIENSDFNAILTDLETGIKNFFDNISNSDIERFAKNLSSVAEFVLNAIKTSIESVPKGKVESIIKSINWAKLLGTYWGIKKDLFVLKLGITFTAVFSPVNNLLNKAIDSADKALKFLDKSVEKTLNIGVGLVKNKWTSFKKWLFGGKNEKGEFEVGLIPKFINTLKETIKAWLGLGNKKDRTIGLFGSLTSYDNNENPTKSLSTPTKGILAKFTSWASRNPTNDLSNQKKGISAFFNGWNSKDPSNTSALGNVSKGISAFFNGWKKEKPQDDLSDKSKGISAFFNGWASNPLSKLGDKSYGISAYVKKSIDTSNIGTVKIGVTGVINKLVNSAGKTVANTASSVASALAGHKADGGIYKNGKWKPITAYGNGGFPDYSSAEIFVARENGAELVGRIGSSTAVMNNDQIVASVSKGVYSAVLSAMTPIAQSISNSGSKGQTNVYVGGRQVTDVIVEEVNKRTKMTGVSPLLI